MNPESLAWRREQLPVGLDLLVSKSGLRGSSQAPLPAAADQTVGPVKAGFVIDRHAARCGLEAECVHATYGNVDAMISGASPAVIQVGAAGEESYFLILRSHRNRIAVIAPDGSERTIRRQLVRDIVCASAETPIREETDLLLKSAGIRGSSFERARRAILNRRLASQHVGNSWIYRLPPDVHFGRQLRQGNIFGRLGTVLSLHAVQQALFVTSWWVIGRAVLQGRLDMGYFLAWVLLLASIIPIRLLENWWQSELLYRAGALVKRRLLAGVLRFDPEQLRKEGSGRLLAQVLESASIENTTLTGGLLTILACIDLVATGFVLLYAPQPALFISAFIVWVALVALGTRQYVITRRHWMQSRLNMSEDLVEKLVAHRTRMAQERPGRWHAGEDEAMDAYYHASIRMDQAAVTMSLLARGWLIVGLVLLSSILISTAIPMAALAVGLAGVLMGAQALTRFNAGLGNLTTALIAAGRIATVFRAGGTTDSKGAAASLCDPVLAHGQIGGPLLEVHQLSFRYEERERQILRACDLTVAPGERLLVEGPSGSGKSTLAKILTAILPTQNGLMTLRGLDCHSLGSAAWRSRVSYVPQFHENHILTGTLAFNLLMGRRWPPSPQDLRDADALCREFGLDGLLARMPGGLMQAVGETGWQLSHGEKSRIFLARSLLAEPDILVADEPLAALDPKSLRQCLRSLVDRNLAVVLIAHH